MDCLYAFHVVIGFRGHFMTLSGTYVLSFEYGKNHRGNCFPKPMSLYKLNATKKIESILLYLEPI